MEFRILGRLEVRVADSPVPLGGGRQQAVLAALLVSPNTTVPRARLARLVWGDPPASAASNLRTYVSKLRRVLRDPGDSRSRLVGDQHGLRLRVADEELDRTRFERWAADGDRALRREEPRAALRDFDRALACWRGAPLDGTLMEPQLGAFAAKLADRRAEVGEQRVRALLALGAHAEVIPDLRAMVTDNPLREAAVALLMTALYRGGRQDEALALFRETSRRLKMELDLAPSPALDDLHRRILSAAPELSPPTGTVLSPVPVVTRPWHRRPDQLPADPGEFSGRADALGALDAVSADAFASTTTLGIAIISGMAGVGKTSLAVRWAHRAAERFADGRLYADLHGFDAAGRPAEPSAVVRGFIAALGVAEQHVPDGLDGQAALYRSLLAGKRVLVLLDNAADADQIRPLLPGSPGCLVVVTSRNRLSGLVATEGATPIGLDVLGADEAEELLAARLGRDRLAAEPKATRALIELGARLPLALSIIAAHAGRRPAIRLADLVRALGAAGDTLTALDSVAPDGCPRAVFSWSYRTLSPAAARMFRLLGAHPHPEVSLPAAASMLGAPRARARAVLAELVDGNMAIERGPDRYTVHDLLRRYAADLAERDGASAERRAAMARLLDHYLHTAHTATRCLDAGRRAVPLVPARDGVSHGNVTDVPGALRWFGTELPALLASQRRGLDLRCDAHVWQLAWCAETYFSRQGRWHDWITAQRLAIRAARRLGDVPALANLHRVLARPYARLGRYPHAEHHLRRALELFGELDDAIGRIDSLRGMAKMMSERRRHRAALDYARQALSLAESHADARRLAYTLNGVGWRHALLGEFGPAMEHCRSALDLFGELRGRRGSADFGEAETLDSLGYIHHGLGDPESAVRCYRQALELLTDLGERYFTTEVLTRLGEVHRDAGRLDDARRHWRRAMDILEDLDHPGAARLRVELVASATAD